MEFELKQIESLSTLAQQLLLAAGDCKIWCFNGPMGAGKTTLIAELCKQLGVQEPVSSPTYGLVNEYRGGAQQAIFHFDFYRIQSLAEAYDMGAEDYFFSGDWCFIEWPDLVKDLLPVQVFTINFSILEGSTRLISTHL
jgi:tRNA threonylcarbamoyladenosine biosynthesis protein TsaE